MLAWVFLGFIPVAGQSGWLSQQQTHKVKEGDAGGLVYRITCLSNWFVFVSEKKAGGFDFLKHDGTGHERPITTPPWVHQPVIGLHGAPTGPHGGLHRLGCFSFFWTAWYQDLQGCCIQSSPG
jgi:hypothetical protein